MGKLYDRLRHYKARLRILRQRPGLIKKMDEAHQSGELKDMPEADYQAWRKSFSAMMGHTYLIKTELLPAFFASAKIQTVHIGQKTLKKDDIIALGVFKDVLVRIQMFVEHGRAIGVDRFAILDNGSPEDVVDWLRAQDDVDLYHTDDPFQTLAKDAWINRLLAKYGPGRWYFQLDSDEMPVFFGMQQKNLHDVSGRLEAMGQTRAAAIMIDMYAKDGLFKECQTGEDIRLAFPYFDPASFVDVDTFGIRQKKGGPRYRLFGYKQMLTKCPFYKLRETEIAIDSHFQWPYDDVRRAPCVFGLLHYKYIAQDREEYFRRAQKGNFAGGSMAYKSFTSAYQQNEDVSFYYEGSVRYEDDGSLKALGFIEDIFKKA